MLGTSNPIHHDGTDALELDVNLTDSVPRPPSPTSTDTNDQQPCVCRYEWDSIPDLLGGGVSPMYLLSLRD